MSEFSDGKDLAIGAAQELLRLNPHHELLQYFDQGQSEGKLDELFDRFWQKEGDWRSKPGSLVGATVFANYFLALEEAVRVEEVKALKIRKAVPEDCKALRRLLGQSDERHHRLRPDVFLGPDEFAYADEQLTNSMADPAGYFIVATVGEGRPIGFVKSGIRVRLEPILVHRTCLFIYDIVVDEQYKGKGVGTKLCEAIFEWGRERGLATVELDVTVNNDEAIAFYAALGFVPIRQRLLRSL